MERNPHTKNHSSMTSIISNLSLALDIIDEFPEMKNIPSRDPHYTTSDSYGHGTASHESHPSNGKTKFPITDDSPNNTLIEVLSNVSQCVSDEHTIHSIKSFDNSNNSINNMNNNNSFNQFNEFNTNNSDIGCMKDVEYIDNEINKINKIKANKIINNNNLVSALGQIVYKFDELFPIYRLSDSDCRKLCSIIYDEFRFVLFFRRYLE